MKFQLTLVRLIFCLSICTISNSHAQYLKLGVKAGGNIGIRDGNSELAGNGGVLKPDMNPGFHIGIFAERNFGRLFVRPEALYLTSSADYVLPVSNITPPVETTYELDRAMVSMLFGYKLSSRFHFFFGPYYQKVLKNEILDNIDQLDDERNLWGAKAGFKFQIFRNLELSMVYEYNFDSTFSQGLRVTGVDGNDYAYVIDEGRLNQFLISLNFSIFNSNPAGKKLRQSSSNRGCYF